MSQLAAVGVPLDVRPAARSMSLAGQRSRPHQHRLTLLDGKSRHRFEALVSRTADWMTDPGKAVARHAQHAAHQLGRAHEPLGHDAEGGNQETFSCYGVVQTAR